MEIRVLAVLLLFCVIESEVKGDYGPWNVRGYVYYPRLEYGWLDPLKFEVQFDYNQTAIPHWSTVDVACVGYQRESPCGDEQISPISTPTWFNTTKVVKPFNQIIFDTKDTIDRYICQARMNTPLPGKWTEPVSIQLPNCSIIKPMPSILVCHNMQPPEMAWADRKMIRTFDLKAGNGPNETVDAEFTKRCPLAYNGMGNHTTFFQPFCFDWIGHWQYRVTPNNTCILKVDMILYVLPESPVNISCREDTRIDDVICYSVRNQIFFTTKHNESTTWSLVRYDRNLNEKTILVNDENVTSAGCNRSVTHPKVIFDYRKFYMMGSLREMDPRVVFVSGDSLWTYSISGDFCEHLATLKDVGVSNSSAMTKYGLDWEYFYWVDKKSMAIKAHSFQDNNTTEINSVQVFDVEERAMNMNITQRITENVTYVEDIMTYSSAERPFPHPLDCLIPHIDITVRMNGPTTAAVVMKKVWNGNSVCTQMSQPPIQLLISCKPMNEQLVNTSQCKFVESVKRSRNQVYSIEAQNLTIGEMYLIIVNASTHDMLNPFRVITKEFYAKPDLTIEITITIVLVAAILFTLAAFILWRIYKRQKHLIYITMEQLEIVNTLGEGAFAKVYHVIYSPSKAKRWLLWWPNLNLVKMGRRGRRKSSRLEETKPAAAKALGPKHRSAVGFVDEMIMLDQIGHPNIIIVYGICHNFPSEVALIQGDRRGIDTAEEATSANRTSTRPQSYENTPLCTRALVLEYMNAGSSINYVEKFHDQVTNRDILKILADVADAFSYLNEQRIIHRDLAARNVLVRVEENQQGHPTRKIIVAKVADFGLAKRANQFVDGLWTYKGQEAAAFRSMAPEAFDQIFTTQTDVWAFGVLIFELYTIIDRGNGRRAYANLQNSEASTSGMGTSANGSGSFGAAEGFSNMEFVSDMCNAYMENSAASKGSPRRRRARENMSNDSFGGTIPEEGVADFLGVDEVPMTRSGAPLINQSTPSTLPQTERELVRQHIDKGKDDTHFVPLQKPVAAPEKIYDLMKLCWAYKPLERITFKQLPRHLTLLTKEEPSELQGRPLYQTGMRQSTSTATSGYVSPTSGTINVDGTISSFVDVHNTNSGM